MSTDPGVVVTGTKYRRVARILQGGQYSHFSSPPGARVADNSLEDVVSLIRTVVREDREEPAPVSSKATPRPLTATDHYWRPIRVLVSAPGVLHSASLPPPLFRPLKHFSPSCQPLRLPSNAQV